MFTTTLGYAKRTLNLCLRLKFAPSSVCPQIRVRWWLTLAARCRPTSSASISSLRLYGRCSSSCSKTQVHCW